jgi:hypothetical protein
MQRLNSKVQHVLSETSVQAQQRKHFRVLFHHSMHLHSLFAPFPLLTHRYVVLPLAAGRNKKRKRPKPQATPVIIFTFFPGIAKANALALHETHCSEPFLYT